MANSIVKQDAWQNAIIANVHATNIALSFCDTTPVVVNAGTAKILSTGLITAGNYTPGSDFTLMDATATANTLTLDQKPYWAINVDDVERVQTNPEALSQITRDGAVAISDAIDTYIFGLYAKAATANKITGASNAAIPFTGGSAKDPYETIVDLATALTKSNAPLTNRWLVVSPEIYGILLKDKDHFINVSNLGNTVVTAAQFGEVASRPGLVGSIAGFSVYCSNHLTKASSNANVYLVGGQGTPFHFASQLGDVEFVRPSMQFSTVAKQLVTFGADVLGPNSAKLGLIYAVNS
ncbi:phage major capsid protein [Paludisphaera rhizosphaerae]|uniref:phage major capsid protein n=1 Tax=Paludisphaera rhizosphaerae TaxID=2711216 RepID=UPI0013EBD2ED|nr:hypothetical protein [Paludisphaera rhizosphaerae]